MPARITAAITFSCNIFAEAVLNGPEAEQNNIAAKPTKPPAIEKTKILVFFKEIPRA